VRSLKKCKIIQKNSKRINLLHENNERFAALKNITICPSHPHRLCTAAKDGKLQGDLF
jgi:hypothetical protein